MKIGIVYFEENLSQNRSHHAVNRLQIDAWTHFYKKSGTTLEPVLLSDRDAAPAGWEYGVVKVGSPNPPQRLDVLNKVGWIKAQGYQTLGDCIIMDLDCLILNSLDHLQESPFLIAMPVDPAKRTYKDWPEAGEELNAGLIVMRSPDIWSRFQHWWKEKHSYLKITYFDEIIFSAICREMNGQVLPEWYNCSWPIGDDAALFAKYSNPYSKILHFHGRRKDQLKAFYERVK